MKLRTERVKLVTGPGRGITFNIIDNPFTEMWFEKFKKMLETHNYFDYVDPQPFVTKEWDQDKAEHHENEIKYAITEINKRGLNFPIDPEDVKFEPNKDTRILLNRLHRHFTTADLTNATWYTCLETEYKKGMGFWNQIRYELDWFKNIIHIINDHVHMVEHMIPSKRAEQYQKYQRHQLVFDTSRGGDYWKYISKEKENTPLKNDGTLYNNCYSKDATEYDIWIHPHQILGKSYLRAYFDYDDPKEWDITIPIVISGSIQIGDMAPFYNDRINKWLRLNNIQPGPMTCGLPIGNIEESDVDPYNMFSGCIQDIQILD
tara:strand:+ start:17208 stop:18161 length:954 start_codon:yes stop_codon:yes gene_type:complete